MWDSNDISSNVKEKSIRESFLEWIGEVGLIFILGLIGLGGLALAIGIIYLIVTVISNIGQLSMFGNAMVFIFVVFVVGSCIKGFIDL